MVILFYYSGINLFFAFRMRAEDSSYDITFEELKVKLIQTYNRYKIHRLKDVFTDFYNGGRLEPFVINKLNNLKELFPKEDNSKLIRMCVALFNDDKLIAKFANSIYLNLNHFVDEVKIHDTDVFGNHNELPFDVRDLFPKRRRCDDDKQNDDNENDEQNDEYQDANDKFTNNKNQHRVRFQPSNLSLVNNLPPIPPITSTQKKDTPRENMRRLDDWTLNERSMRLYNSFKKIV